jgi:predicted membrane-bound mannosyltransferase
VLYFSRFARDDIFMVVWVLLLLICLVKYVEQPRARYLYFAAIVFSLSFATMETSYIFGVILLSFLFLRSAFGRRGVPCGRISTWIASSATSPKSSPGWVGEASGPS